MEGADGSSDWLQAGHNVEPVSGPGSKDMHLLLVVSPLFGEHLGHAAAHLGTEVRVERRDGNGWVPGIFGQDKAGLHGADGQRSLLERTRSEGPICSDHASDGVSGRIGENSR